LAQGFFLDSEALSALALQSRSSKAQRRARAVLRVAQEVGADLTVSAAVLAETARGRALEAAVMNVLRALRIAVHPVGVGTARQAGRLLHHHGLGSEHAVDAFVVATALELGGGLIATGDARDIKRLASGERQLAVFALD
jgi:predicted nucleic acid-binding protein